MVCMCAELHDAGANNEANIAPTLMCFWQSSSFARKTVSSPITADKHTCLPVCLCRLLTAPALPC
jgi:hypothetical protein